MTLRYPFALATMVDPADHETPRDQDFNRLRLEINAIEATLGVNPHGTTGSLAARLNVDTYATGDANGAGYIKGQVCCEADPTKANRASRRWLAHYKFTLTGSSAPSNVGEYIRGFPYCIFDVPDADPVCIATPVASTANADAQVGRWWNQASSPALLRIKTTRHDASLLPSIDFDMHILALGSLEVVDDDNPVMGRMDRIGAISTGGSL